MWGNAVSYTQSEQKMH